MTRLNWFQKLVAGDKVKRMISEATYDYKQALDTRNSEVATLMEIVNKSEGLIGEVKRLKAIINEYAGQD